MLDPGLAAADCERLPPLEQAAGTGGGHRIHCKRVEIGHEALPDCFCNIGMGDVEQTSLAAASGAVGELDDLHSRQGLQESSGRLGDLHLETQVAGVVIQNPPWAVGLE